MSSFGFKVKNKKTGETVEVFAIDDYFAHHVYGYKVEGVEEVLTLLEFEMRYERVDIDV